MNQNSELVMVKWALYLRKVALRSGKHIGHLTCRLVSSTEYSLLGEGTTGFGSLFSHVLNYRVGSHQI